MDSAAFGKRCGKGRMIVVAEIAAEPDKNGSSHGFQTNAQE
jgi:hypothetical protein